MISEKITYFILVGCLVLAIISCSNKKSPSSAKEVDSLLVQYKAMNDSVNSNWAVMIADDDDKHVLMKRLLLEVSYTNNYDKTLFKELSDLVDDLKVMRYDQRSMKSSAAIDAYDSATFALTDQIILFARSHPRFADFPLMEELIDDINAKNNFILLHRIHYDNWVKEMNLFKESNKKKLLSGDPSVEIEQMPLFELPS